MKEFSNRIFLCPADQLPVNITAPYNEFDQLHSDIDIDPGITNPQNSGNSFYELDLRVAFSDVTPAVINKYRGGRPFVAILFDTDGGAYQLGNAQQKLRATISTRKFVNDIKISAQLLDDPFSS